MSCQTIRVSSSGIAAIALVLALGTPALAGVGTWRKEGNQQVLDFCVSLRWAATNTQIAKIEAGFAAAGPVLADALDGKVRLGNVSILNGSAGSTEAEIWIYEGEGDAVATFGEYGVRGEHIRLYYASNFDAPNHPIEATAYTIAHELGHHVWSLGDEYEGPGDCCIDTSASPCAQNEDVCDCEPWPGDGETTFCLMDNYFRRGGNNGSVWNVDPPIYGTFTLNELCTQLNHDPDGDTEQHVFNGMSCWIQIGTHALRRVPAPSDANSNPVPPDDPPPAVPAPTFVPLTADNRFALVIDRSLSMQTQDAGDGATRLFRAKQASQIAINQMQPDYDLGIVQFSTGADPLLILTPMSDDNKALALEVVDDITAAGATAIGLALIEARGLINPLPDACNQPVVLMTDGFGNTGPSELTQIDDLVVDRIPVTTIAIGSDVNEANLVKVANETGGRYWHVDSAEDLPMEFSFLEADLSGGGVLAAETGMSQAAVELHTVDVDDLTKEVTFVLSWSEQPADLGIQLISPTGQVLTPAQAAADPQLDFYSGLNHEILRVRDTAVRPLQGGWRVRVLPEVSTFTEYALVAVSDTPDYALSASAVEPIYDCGEEIVIHATPQYLGRGLRGVPVMADYHTPDGTSGTIVLLDDGGYAVSRDSRADDGVYSARFLPPAPAGPGTYSFEVTAVNTAGQTVRGEALFHEQVPNPPVPVAPPFTRIARVHVPVACVTVPGDCDGDGVVGTGDFAQFNACFTGQGGTLQSGCECSDLDGDLLVDCVDWQAFRAGWGPGGPPPSFPQCEGGTIPETVTAERLDPAGSRIRLSWAAGCSTTARDYAIYEGHIGRWYDLAPVTCSTAGAVTSLVSTSPGDTYYLVVPTNGEIEGSYGRARQGGSETERPVAAAACAPAQDPACP